MKNLKTWYITSGSFGLVGIILYAIVLGEFIINKALSPNWVSTLKIIGLIAFVLSLLVLVTMVVCETIIEKKQIKEQKTKVSDEEILAKYKSIKNKK